jgi:hypothetical protein
VSSAGAVFASSEGVEAPLLRIKLPREVRRAVAPPASPTPSDSPSTKPRDEVRDGVEQDDSREVWPWVVGGAFGLAALVVLIRSLRPR